MSGLVDGTAGLVEETRWMAELSLPSDPRTEA